MRVLPGSKNWIICCSFRQFFPKPFFTGKRQEKTAAEHRGRVIEVVITSRTRNAVVRKGTWVRIPPSPPTKPVIAMVTGFWIFWKSLFLLDFQWAELLNTWAELLRFLKNTGYECQLESEPRARLILSHLCSFESDPPKHRSSNDPDGRSSHSYQEYMIWM